MDRKLWLGTHSLNSVKWDYYDSPKNLHIFAYLISLNEIKKNTKNIIPLFIVELSVIFTLKSHWKDLSIWSFNLDVANRIFFFKQCKQTKIGNKSFKSHKTNVQNANFFLPILIGNLLKRDFKALQILDKCQFKILSTKRNKTKKNIRTNNGFDSFV